MRAVRRGAGGIPVEAGGAAWALCGGEPGGGGKGLPPEYAGLHLLRMEGDRAEISGGQGAAGPGEPGGHEGVGQHRAGRDLGGAGRSGGGRRAAGPPGAVRGGRAGRRAGADRRDRRAGRPLRGGSGRLGRRQGELGHSLPEDFRRPAEGAGLDRPGRLFAGGLPEEGRDGAAHIERVHGQRRSLPRPGAALHPGPVGAEGVGHQGQGRQRRAVYPQPNHQQPGEGAAVHPGRRRGKGPAVPAAAAPDQGTQLLPLPHQRGGGV